LDIKNDLPILLTQIQFEDDYEGDMTTRRAIIWTLSFTMKLNFYGPVSKQGIINRVVANTFRNVDLTNQLQSISVSGTNNTANAILAGNVNYVNSFTDF